MKHTLPFLFLLACGGLGGPQATVATGECEGNAKSVPDDTGGSAEPGAWAEAEGSTVVVHLDDVSANCCPSPDAEVAIEGDRITVDFQDVTEDEGCDCVCITDFTVEIADVPSGAYTVDVNLNGADFAETTVEVG